MNQPVMYDYFHGNTLQLYNFIHDSLAKNMMRPDTVVVILLQGFNTSKCNHFLVLQIYSTI